jgi:transketolase
MVAQALIAAEMLSREQLDVRVIDCHTAKPLDAETILCAARETGAMVTAESNIYYGGLGSAVAEVLVESEPIPMQRVGVQDTFAESGPYLALLEKYGLSACHIAEAVRHVVRRKGQR